MMAYLTKEFVSFFEELERNNNREWFLDNKKRYEKNVKQPFEQLVTEMLERMSKADKSLSMQAKDAIFRINRDIRFSQDKSPYKTHVSAAISPGGKKDYLTPGIYFEFSAKGGNIYGGIWAAEKDDLYRIREYIAGNLAAFDKALKSKDFVRLYKGEILGEKNKKIAPEFAEYAEKQPLILNKSFYYTAQLKKADMLSDKLPEVLMEYNNAALPVKDFLTKAIAH